MKTNPIPSIKAIAVRAGVSIGTVDRVLHHRKGVSGKTKSKIEEIITRMGYKPNIYARNLVLARTFHFSVLMPRFTQDSSYWRIPAKGIDKARCELEAYKVGVSYHTFNRYSESSFQKSFREVLRNRPDGILIAPVLPNVASRLIPLIPNEIPYAFFDSNIPKTKCLTSVGQDPFQSGILAAHLMQMVVKKKGTIAIVKVLPEDFHISERIRGFYTALQQVPGLSVRLYSVDSHVGEKNFYVLARMILRENKNLRGIFVSNAWTYPFAQTFKATAGKKKIFVIGYDLVPKNIQCLGEGAIDFLISQRPEMQGYEGIYSLYRHIVLRETIKKQILVPLDVLTRDNVKYFQDFPGERQ
jgi:LacI family transcriptional regulator